MLLSQVLENTWTLSLDGMTYIAHTPQAPFAVALRREKTYESDRGTVKEHVVEAERVPLMEVAETAEGVVLSGGGHSLQVQAVPCDGGAELLFSGEDVVNTNRGFQMLRAKLYLLKKQENENQLSDIRGEVKDNGWGSQIRSYVFQPYTMVKDLRTQAETGNVQAVMDGGLDLFMNAYLKWIHTDRKANE